MWTPYQDISIFDVKDNAINLYIKVKEHSDMDDVRNYVSLSNKLSNHKHGLGQL